jgi:hypothetical protein
MGKGISLCISDPREWTRNVGGSIRASVSRSAYLVTSRLLGLKLAHLREQPDKLPSTGQKFMDRPVVAG